MTDADAGGREDGRRGPATSGSRRGGSARASPRRSPRPLLPGARTAPTYVASDPVREDELEPPVLALQVEARHRPVHEALRPVDDGAQEGVPVAARAEVDARLVEGEERREALPVRLEEPRLREGERQRAGRVGAGGEHGPGRRGPPGDGEEPNPVRPVPERPRRHARRREAGARRARRPLPPRIPAAPRRRAASPAITASSEPIAASAPRPIDEGDPPVVFVPERDEGSRRRKTPLHRLRERLEERRQALLAERRRRDVRAERPLPPRFGPLRLGLEPVDGGGERVGHVRDEPGLLGVEDSPGGRVDDEDSQRPLSPPERHREGAIRRDAPSASGTPDRPVSPVPESTRTAVPLRKAAFPHDGPPWRVLRSIR